MLSQLNHNHDKLRGAIEKTLSTFLPERDLQFALARWDENHAASVDANQVSNLMAFLGDLAPLLNLDQKRLKVLPSAIYSHVYGISSNNSGNSSQKTLNASQPPVQVQEVAKQDGVSLQLLREKVSASPAFLVFTELGRGLIEGVQRAGYAELNHFIDSIKDHLTHVNLSHLAQDALIDWCSHRGVPIPGTIQEDELQGAVHVLYLAACDAVGPASADAIMRGAVSSAQQLPEARLFPPNRLL